MSRLNLTLLMLAVLGTACYKDDSSGPANRRPMAKVLLTDSPFPYDTVDRVDIYVVSISASTQSDTATSADSMSWVTITAPHRTFNLLDLQQGTTALVGEGELPADQYRAVRLVINTDSSAVIGVGGSPRLVHWNGPAIQAIHAFVENPVAVPEQGAEIVIDFDVGRSFHYNDLDDGYFNFFPWIRAVNKAATGSVAGTITSNPDSSGIPAGPVKGATVSAWGASEGTWQIFSTAPTDAAGHYRLAYLNAGTYIVQVDPPTTGGFQNLGPNLDSSVVVSQGLETDHSVALVPQRSSLTLRGSSTMLVGSFSPIEAIVVNDQGQQVPDAAPVWEILDPEYVGFVNDSARFGRAFAARVGHGRIAARWGVLADTLRITVYPDSSSPAPRR